MPKEIKEKIIEEWGKEIKPLANAIYYQGVKDCDNDKEDFDRVDIKPLVKKIARLLKKEKEKLIHDHEILVNTILEEKNREIETLKQEIKKELKKERGYSAEGEEERGYSAEGEEEVEARGRYEEEMKGRDEEEAQRQYENNQPSPEEPPF